MIEAEVVFYHPDNGRKFTGRAKKFQHRKQLDDYINNMGIQGYLMDEVYIISDNDEQE